MPVDNFGREIPTLDASDLLGATKVSQANAEPSNKELSDLMRKMSDKFDENMDKTRGIFEKIMKEMNSDKGGEKNDSKAFDDGGKIYNLLKMQWDASGGAGGAKRLNELVEHGLTKGSMQVADHHLLVELKGMHETLRRCCGIEGIKANANLGGDEKGQGGVQGGGGGGGVDLTRGLLAIIARVLRNVPIVGQNLEAILGALNTAINNISAFGSPANYGLSHLFEGQTFNPLAQITEINKSQVDIKRAIYQTQGLTKESGYMLENFVKIQNAAISTGFSQAQMEKEVLKYIKAGVKDRRTMQKAAIAQLHTERQLGLAAGDLHEYFRMLHLEAGMTSIQLGVASQNMTMIARNTGLTGEHMKKAIQSSAVFVKEMRNAGTLTNESLKNITQMSASFQKFGVAEQGAEMQKYLTNSTKLLLDGNDAMSTLMRQAAASGGVYNELMTGTVQHSEKSMKKFSKGFSKVLKSMGLSTMEEFERLSAVEKMQKNMIAFARTGKQAGELLMMKKALDESAKTFTERYNDLIVERARLGKRANPEQIAAIEKKKFDMQTERVTSVFGALEQALKNSGKDFNKAGVLFQQARKQGNFDEAFATIISDVRKKKGKPEITAQELRKQSGAEFMTTIAREYLPELNRRLKEEGLKEVGYSEADIADAIKKGNKEQLQKIMSEIISAQQELKTADLEKLDPTTDLLYKINIHASKIRQMMHEMLLYTKRSAGDILTDVDRNALAELEKLITDQGDMVKRERIRERQARVMPNKEDQIIDVEERAVGTDLITKGGLAYLHPGEMIIPKEFNQVMQDTGPFTGKAFADVGLNNILNPMEKMASVFVNRGKDEPLNISPLFENAGRKAFADVAMKNIFGPMNEMTGALMDDLVYRGEKVEITDLLNRLPNVNARRPIATVPNMNEMPLSPFDARKNERIKEFLDDKSQYRKVEEKNSEKILLTLTQISKNTVANTENRGGARNDGVVELVSKMNKKINNIDPRFAHMRGGHFTKSDAVNIQY